MRDCGCLGESRQVFQRRTKRHLEPQLKEWPAPFWYGWKVGALTATTLARAAKLWKGLRRCHCALGFTGVPKKVRLNEADWVDLQRTAKALLSQNKRLVRWNGTVCRGMTRYPGEITICLAGARVLPMLLHFKLHRMPAAKRENWQNQVWG